MPIVRLNNKNVEVLIPTELANRELYASAIRSSNLSKEEQEKLMKEAGFMDSFTGLFTGGLFPIEDFKRLWTKEQQPGGAFTNRIITLKEATQKGRLNASLLIQGLEALAASGSAKATELLPKYKMTLESGARGKNAQAAADAQKIISELTTEFQKLIKTTPPNYTGTTMDKSRSKYV